MKVLLVHGRYRSEAPSGENHVVDQEAEQLRAAGHHVAHFERRSDDIATWSLQRKAGLPVRSIWDEQVRRELVRSLEADRPDVVHIHNTFPLLSASVLYACRDVGVPVVVTLHNYKLLCASGDFFREGAPCHACARGSGLPGLIHGCYRGSRAATLPVVLGNAINRQAWRHLVSAYIFVSAAQRELMAALELPADRVFVKHNFVPPGPEPELSREHRVAYVGRLDAAKGLPLLMRSWDLFRSQNVDSRLQLVIAGGGPLESQVRSWAERHGTVTVAGLLPRTDAQTLLSRSLAAVVPSQWEETFGLVAVEAMAAGVAPVAPASGSFPELINDRVDGVLFRAGDRSALARELAHIDRDPWGAVAIGERARSSYHHRFSPEDNVARLLDIYRFVSTNPLDREEVARQR
ncbi:MAG TPA: glycosyltransferase [Segeticoccus sp.]|nr:glycosyltransferase [Segeticoccus sp.]